MFDSKLLPFGDSSVVSVLKELECHVQSPEADVIRALFDLHLTRNKEFENKFSRQEVVKIFRSEIVDLYNDFANSVDSFVERIVDRQALLLAILAKDDVEDIRERRPHSLSLVCLRRACLLYDQAQSIREGRVSQESLGDEALFVAHVDLLDQLYNDIDEWDILENPEDIAVFTLRVGMEIKTARDYVDLESEIGQEAQECIVRLCELVERYVPARALPSPDFAQASQGNVLALPGVVLDIPGRDCE